MLSVREMKVSQQHCFFLNEVVEVANGSEYPRQMKKIARRRCPRDEPENQCFPDSPSWGPVLAHLRPGESWPSSLQPRIGKFVGIGRGALISRD